MSDDPTSRDWLIREVADYRALEALCAGAPPGSLRSMVLEHAAGTLATAIAMDCDGQGFTDPRFGGELGLLFFDGCLCRMPGYGLSQDRIGPLLDALDGQPDGPAVTRDIYDLLIRLAYETETDYPQLAPPDPAADERDRQVILRLVAHRAAGEEPEWGSVLHAARQEALPVSAAA